MGMKRFSKSLSIKKLGKKSTRSSNNGADDGNDSPELSSSSLNRGKKKRSSLRMKSIKDSLSLKRKTKSESDLLSVSDHTKKKSNKTSQKSYKKILFSSKKLKAS